jgi:hypothetical protein
MISIFGMFSLVEWVIFSFIGANLALAATCIFHRGGKRFPGLGEE